MAGSRGISITLPDEIDKLAQISPGEIVYINGIIYTARDQAHKRLLEDIKNRSCPIDINKSVIYYCGPTPAKDGLSIGSCGPTTSSRMDKFMPQLIKYGLKAVIGKGERAKEIEELMRQKGVKYLLAPGGAGAYLSTKVISSKIIAYPELGAEAIYELHVKDFPVVVKL